MTRTIIHKNNEAFFGDEKHLEVAQKKDFAEMIFEMFGERSPNDGEPIRQAQGKLKVFELILNLTIDHGSETPSAVAVIEAARAGKTISESVAAGILQINDTHGGAGEGCMEILYKIKNEKLNIKNFVAECLAVKKRIPGYGHRIYKIDPRAELIFKMMRASGIGEDYIVIAKDIERELKAQSGKNLPVNIDGAIAVFLCALGWKPILAKAVFIVARMPGLCGQFLNNS